MVSVGNLHWGGSGKTPLVAAIAAHLRDRGAAVCILSRGYASAGTGRAGGEHRRGAAPRTPGRRGRAGAARRRAPRGGRGRRPRPPPRRRSGPAPPGARARPLPARRRLLPPAPPPRPRPGGLPRRRSLRRRPAPSLRPPARAARRDGPRARRDPHRSARGGRRGAELAAALRSHGFTGPGFASRHPSREPQRTGGGELPPAPGSSWSPPSPGRRPSPPRRGASGSRSRASSASPTITAIPPASLARIAAAWRASGAAAVLTTSKDRVKLHGPARPAARRAPHPRRARAGVLGVAGWGGGADSGMKIGSPHRATALEYGFYLLLKGFLRALPHRAARAFGRGLGAFVHAIDRRHREIALRNMALALPGDRRGRAAAAGAGVLPPLRRRPLRRHLRHPLRRPRLLPSLHAGGLGAHRRGRAAWARGSSCSPPISASGSSRRRSSASPAAR